MQRIASNLRHGALLSRFGAGMVNSHCHLTTRGPPSSFNPEAYLRFPQFLHDINSKLTQHKDTQETADVLAKGRLVYIKKCVTVEQVGTLYSYCVFEPRVKLIDANWKFSLCGHAEYVAMF